MDNMDLVQSSLRAKINAYYGIVEAKPIETRPKVSYEDAKSMGRVDLMIRSKFKIDEQIEREARKEAEYKTEAIDKWLPEYESIDGKISEVQAEIEKKMEQLKADIQRERLIEERRLIQKGFAKGHLNHLILNEKYAEALAEIPNMPEVRELKYKLHDLADRRSNLEYYITKYRIDNAELIDRLTNQQKEQAILKSGLIK